MNLPDGDHAGRMLLNRSLVIQFICFDSKFTTRISNFVRTRFWKTIFLPSGDQEGATWATSSLVSVVICCGLWPSRSTTQIRRGAAQDASTATRLPSGEYDGLNALSTSLLSLPDARSSTHTSPSWNSPKTSPGCSFTPGWCARTNATCLPSGDQVGWSSSKSLCVNWESSRVAKSFRKILWILPTSPVYSRFLPSGDHAGYSSTPSANVTWESVVCKAGPEPLPRVPIRKTSAMTAPMQTTAGINQRVHLPGCMGNPAAETWSESASRFKRCRSVRTSAACW